MNVFAFVLHSMLRCKASHHRHDDAERYFSRRRRVIVSFPIAINRTYRNARTREQASTRKSDQCERSQHSDGRGESSRCLRVAVANSLCAVRRVSRMIVCTGVCVLHKKWNVNKHVNLQNHILIHIPLFVQNTKRFRPTISK